MYDKRIQWIYNLLDTLISIFRMFLLTKFKSTKRIERKYDRCIIMGTGPSLIDSLEQNKESLNKIDLIAVNFMGLSSEYIEYKPNIYVLCDTGFCFEGISTSTAEKVEAFYWTLVEKTDWLLQLYIPYQARKVKKIRDILSQNKNINLNYYNKIRFEGYKWLKYFIYNKQWGMPRAQNVISASLMLAVYSKYKEIYIAGAENNWMQYLWVDENNKLRCKSNHFFEKSEEDIFMSVDMVEQCEGFYYTFKSYKDIGKYSNSNAIKIYNLTIDSFIDAFEKKTII